MYFYFFKQELWSFITAEYDNSTHELVFVQDSICNWKTWLDHYPWQLLLTTSIAAAERYVACE